MTSRWHCCVKKLTWRHLSTWANILRAPEALPVKGYFVAPVKVDCTDEITSWWALNKRNRKVIRWLLEYFILSWDKLYIKDQVPLEGFLKFIKVQLTFHYANMDHNRVKANWFTQSSRGNSTQFAWVWHQMPRWFCRQPCNEYRKDLLQKINLAVAHMVLLITDLLYGSQQVLLLAQDVLQEGLFELCDLAGLHFV